jgi:hypothetical protein
MNLNPNQRIFDAVNYIRRGVYRIPNIQRSYEWNRERVIMLLDSIMNGYPIGAIMVWLPEDKIRDEIPTRRFIERFDSKQDYLTETPHEADSGDIYMVLDGQQRLQSLYIAFLGSYDGERVYLKVDHTASDGNEDANFPFEFLLPEAVKTRPEMIHVAELIALNSDTKYRFAETLARKLATIAHTTQEQESLFDQKRSVISINIDRFIERFNIQDALLFQEVEKRHGYDHILEIFERVNSGGMVLSKSDLLFSTLKLKLQEMEGKFVGTLAFMNQRDRHNFNTDFLIKAALVIFGQKAKYEVKKLKDDDFIKNLKARYGELDRCLRQMLAWLDDVALIKCARFLRSHLALIPILDFMMMTGNRDKPDGDNGRAMREYLYMASFLRLFSRGPDRVLDQIHDKLVEATTNDPKNFPIQALRDYMRERKAEDYCLHSYQYTNDADLVLNIVDGGVLQIDPTDPQRHPKDLKLEVDHIFPRTPLTNMGLGDVVNEIGNYRLIVMPANRRKHANMPDSSTALFGRDDQGVEKLYQAALQNLNRESFVAFRDARAALIRSKVEQFLGVKTV